LFDPRKSERCNATGHHIGQEPPPHETDNDIRKGFVYKRVPHVTLKSIASNPEIKEGQKGQMRGQRCIMSTAVTRS
jgi:hypothetical protein